MQVFNFTADHLTLRGWLHLPNTPRPNFVIGSHGLLSSGSSAKQIALAHALNRLGIAYIRFDHRGTGQSAGDFETKTTLANRTRDLTAVYAHARKNFALGAKFGLFGSSMGGATCLNAFSELQPNALVTVAAPVASADVLPRIHPQDPNLAFFSNVNKSFNIQPKLTDINHVLVIHGTADEIVPCEQADIIFNAAKEPKKLLLLENADHVISDPNRQNLFMEAAVGWFSRFLC